MSCIDEATLLLYLDRELEPDVATRVETHLSGCIGCRERRDALRIEDALLARAMDHVPSPLPASGAASWTLVAFGALLWAAAISLAARVSLPGWLETLGVLTAVSFVMDGASAFDKEGTTMILHWLSVGLGGGLVMLALLLFLARPLRLHRAALAIPVALLAMLTAAPAHAFEVRKGDNVTVGAAETIDGRAALAGENVTVDGNIQGDLVAAGRHVVVRGTIAGNLYAVGEDVEILGAVDGNVHAAAARIRLESAVKSSAYLVGETVTLTRTAKVAYDLAGAGGQIRIEGAVGRDADVACREVYLSGSAGRNVALHVEKGNVDGSAKIGGSLRANVASEGRLTIAEQASIVGQRDVKVHKEWAEHRKSDRLGWGIFCAVFSLLTTLLFAFLGLRFAPRSIPGAPMGPTQIVKWLGVGFVLLVTVPVACFFAALTVVGIPAALMTMGIYFMVCYLASVAMAIVLGRRLLPAKSLGRLVAATALGWAVLYGLGLIPFVGAGIRFLVVLVGLGALFFTVRDLWRGRTQPGSAMGVAGSGAAGAGA